MNSTFPKLKKLQILLSYKDCAVKFLSAPAACTPEGGNQQAGLFAAKDRDTFASVSKDTDYCIKLNQCTCQYNLVPLLWGDTYLLLWAGTCPSATLILCPSLIVDVTCTLSYATL